MHSMPYETGLWRRQPTRDVKPAEFNLGRLIAAVAASSAGGRIRCGSATNACHPPEFAAG
jgi:hypothetical protein